MSTEINKFFTKEAQVLLDAMVKDLESAGSRREACDIRWKYEDLIDKLPDKGRVLQ